MIRRVGVIQVIAGMIVSMFLFTTSVLAAENNGKATPIVFLQNEKLMCKKDINKEDAPVCLGNLFTPGYFIEWESILISDDGKYIYFSGYDYDKLKKLLYYVVLDELGSNEEENIKCFRKIDYDIKSNYKIVGECEVVYSGDNDTLWYYNGKQKENEIRLKIDQNVFEYDFDKKAKRINYIKQEDCAGGHSVYYFDLNKREGKLLVEGWPVSGLSNSEFILIYRPKIIDHTKDYTDQLCCIGLDGKITAIDTDISGKWNYNPEEKFIGYTKYSMVTNKEDLRSSKTSICCYKQGKVITIEEDIENNYSPCGYESNFRIYTMHNDTKKYCIIDEKKMKNVDSLEVEYYRLSHSKDYMLALAEEDHSIAYIYEVKNGAFINRQLLTENFVDGDWFGDTLYYLVKQSSGEENSDLYQFKGGNSKKIFSFREHQRMSIFNDGYYAIFETLNNGADKIVTLYDKHNNKINSCNDFIMYSYRENGNAVYMQGDKLYAINASNKIVYIGKNEGECLMGNSTVRIFIDNDSISIL